MYMLPNLSLFTPADQQPGHIASVSFPRYKTTNNAVFSDHVQTTTKVTQPSMIFLDRTHKCQICNIVCASIATEGNDLAGRVNATRVCPTVCCNLWSKDARNLDPPNGAMPPFIIIPRFFLYTLWYCYSTTCT
jgi:hypothetical protein